MQDEKPHKKQDEKIGEMQDEKHNEKYNEKRDEKNTEKHNEKRNKKSKLRLSISAHSTSSKEIINESKRFIVIDIFCI